MNTINILDAQTIDKIAAGEVVERPSSVVKELMENAMDAMAQAITIEIREGGISFIRITDDGIGIEKSEIKKAFLRHATSKIKKVEDLTTIASLGFRGEALSSISAVSKVEFMSKTKDALLGTRVVIEGGIEKQIEEVGLPNGTTILVKDLFYNTPVRKKFLKSAQTEGSYIGDLCEHLALSRPDISVKFIQNGQVKFHTSGTGNLKEVISRIFGRVISKELQEISYETNDLSIKGYLGNKTITKGNRNYEYYFVNGRYIKSDFIAKALEDGYKEYLMQHKFPFVVLNFTIAPHQIDVNVHPTKMDIRFTNGELYFEQISNAVKNALQEKECIPEITWEEPKTITPTKANLEKIEYKPTPEPFQYEARNKIKEEIYEYHIEPQVQEHVQMDLFEEKIISKPARCEFKIIGQVFRTYWLIEYKEQLLYIDQHAAHEKVLYERLVQKLKEKKIETQSINPPMIFTLNSKEMGVLQENELYFNELGFTWDDFGSNTIALRTIPLDLYGLNERECFLGTITQLLEDSKKNMHMLMEEKLASMSCKGAIKGNRNLSYSEMDELINQLLTLENPYNCPHGRPVIVTMTKLELEKKFKRILS
ncbi:MAG: DNA mismatch repair endonuclease MutL [Lachnospiraceae bacterium]